MTSNVPVYNSDSLEEWIRKTNVLIDDVGDVAILLNESDILGEQFQRIPDGTTGTVFATTSGRLRVKNAITPIPAQLTTLPSPLSMVYIDLDDSDIKAISILSALDAYSFTVAGFDGQAEFDTAQIPTATSSVWLNDRELAYGVDWSISGDNVLLAPSAGDVLSGDIVFVGDIDTTAYDALENIITIYKAMPVGFVDLRTWAFINKVTDLIVADIPVERYFDVTDTPKSNFNLGTTKTSTTIVYVDGLRKEDGVDYIADTINSVVFFTPVPVGSRVIIVGITKANEIEIVTLLDEVTATIAAQTVFSFTKLPVKPFMALWIDGERQSPTTFTVDTVTNELTLGVGVSIGAKLIASVSFQSNGTVYFQGGVEGQIAERDGTDIEDWSWHTPSFDASVLTSSIVPTARLPLNSNIFTSDSATDVLANPYYVQLRTWVDAWRPFKIGFSSDWDITGQTRNAIRGNGFNNTNGRPYNEFYLSQKYGRVIKNPLGSLEEFREDVPNAPFSINGIASCRVSTSVYDVVTYAPIDFLIVVGDKGKLAYTKNVVAESTAKSSIFDTWVVINTNPFNSDWDFVDVISIMTSGNTLSASVTDVIEYVFVSAYNKTTNKSSVMWKPAAEITNESLPWRQFAPFNNTNGVTGKITKFAGVPKIWGGNGTATSTAVVHFAVADYIYQISNYDLPFNPYMSGVHSTDYPTRIFPNQGMQLTYTVDASFNFTTGYTKNFTGIPLTQTYPFAGQNFLGIVFLEESYSFYAVQKNIATGVEKLLVRDVDFTVNYLDAPLNHSSIKLIDYPSPSPTNSKFYGSTIKVTAHKILRKQLVGETITGVYGFTTKSKSTTTKTEERLWFATTESGKIYRKTTQLAEYPATTTPTGWVEIANCPYGVVKNITAVGEICYSGTSVTTLKFLAFFDGGCAEFDYSVAGSENYRLARHVKSDGIPKFVAFFADHSLFSTSAASKYTSRTLIQNECGAVAKVKANYSGSSVGDVMQTTQDAFITPNTFIPNVGFHGVVSDGISRVCVAKAPVNCLWILKDSIVGGRVVPVEGDILGGFYETSRFIVVTTRFIYSSSDAVTWVKVPYSANFANRGDVDISSSIVADSNGQIVWVLANNDDSAVSYDGINWTKQFSPRTYYKIVAGQYGIIAGGIDTFSTSKLGAIFPKQYKGNIVGNFLPPTGFPVANSYTFNVRNPALISTDISQIKVRGIFKNQLTGQVSTEKETTTFTVSSFSTITNPTSSLYGANWRLTGEWKFLIAGNVYEVEIDDGSSSGAVVPYRSVSSDGYSFISVDVDGYLIASLDGFNWQKLNSGETFIDVMDGLTHTVVGSIDLQYDGVTDGMKYTSIQYTNSCGYIMARKNGHIVNVKNLYDIKEWIPFGASTGSVKVDQPFISGDYITDMYGKKMVWAKTVSGKIFLMAGSLNAVDVPDQWLKMSVPIHSDDEPSGVSYDTQGNYFITSKTLGNKTGETPIYYQWKF